VVNLNLTVKIVITRHLQGKGNEIFTHKQNFIVINNVTNETQNTFLFAAQHRATKQRSKLTYVLQPER
jgi:hypothetical protein